ncbi:MAG: NTP transferase domain-containing protein, partial [Deltaproteobacteria bacterium]|nr:NTP transferase domain-containing protein [Deltaproteobacteria bacterium]
MLDAVILAAGLSRRMGTDKTALEISGKTILTRIVVETLK